MSLAAPERPKLKDVGVAAILDEMSTDCFAPECELVTPTPNNWLEMLEAQQPHLLLVESAWQGNQGAWQYKVGAYSYPGSVGLPDLTALIEWCRARSIPTVFWNKEDPIHFEKFKEAASLFDVVLTTDSNVVERYRALPGGNSDRVVDVLPFAAQLALHNPAGSLQHRDPRPSVRWRLLQKQTPGTAHAARGIARRGFAARARHLRSHEWSSDRLVWFPGPIPTKHRGNCAISRDGRGVPETRSLSQC